MRIFEYTIKDEVGLHARPAGMLAKLAKELGGIITIEKDGKCVDATKLFGLMGLGIVKGDTIKVTIQDAVQEGNEIETEKKLKEFFEANL